jgi:3-hydroxyacyl-CoA dehydrogenase
MVVNLQRQGDVALIAMDNPPVNALGYALRSGLMQALEQLRGERDLRAIVLAGTARAFSGGADITEFGKPMQQPDLRALIAAVEVPGRRGGLGEGGDRAPPGP